MAAIDLMVPKDSPPPIFTCVLVFNPFDHKAMFLHLSVLSQGVYPSLWFQVPSAGVPLSWPESATGLLVTSFKKAVSTVGTHTNLHVANGAASFGMRALKMAAV